MFEIRVTDTTSDLEHVVVQPEMPEVDGILLTGRGEFKVTEIVAVDGSNVYVDAEPTS